MRGLGRLVVGASLILGVVGCGQGSKREAVDDGKPVEAVAFSPDGKTLAIGYGNFTLNVLDSDSDTVVREFKSKLPEDPKTIASVAFSPDGQTLAAGIQSRLGGGINVWDVATARRKLYLDQLAQSVAFRPMARCWRGAGRSSKT